MASRRPLRTDHERANVMRATRGAVHRSGRGGAMHFVSPGGTPRYPTPAEVRHDEVELAEAIRHGAVDRPEQAFGSYFIGRAKRTRRGAAHEVAPESLLGPVH